MQTFPWQTLLAKLMELVENYGIGTLTLKDLPHFARIQFLNSHQMDTQRHLTCLPHLKSATTMAND